MIVDFLADFFDLPWQSVFGFFAFLALMLFTFGPKIPFVVRYFGSGVRELFGVTEGFNRMEAALQAETQKRDEGQRLTNAALNALVEGQAGIVQAQVDHDQKDIERFAAVDGKLDQLKGKSA